MSVGAAWTRPAAIEQVVPEGSNRSGGRAEPLRMRFASVNRRSTGRRGRSAARRRRGSWPVSRRAAQAERFGEVGRAAAAASSHSVRVRHWHRPSGAAVRARCREKAGSRPGRSDRAGWRTPVGGPARRPVRDDPIIDRVRPLGGSALPAGGRGEVGGSAAGPAPASGGVSSMSPPTLPRVAPPSPSMVDI